MSNGGPNGGGTAGEYGDLTDAEAERAAVAALDPPPRPRARRADPDDRAPSPLGLIPAGVGWWGISKRNDLGVWESQGWAAPGAGVESREWPLAELTEATIRARWGAGHFEPHWIRVTPNGGRRVLRGAREIRILPLPVEASPAPPPPVAAGSPLGEAFALARELRAMVKDESDTTLNGLATMAQMFAGRQQQGLGAAELELILQRVIAASSAATSAAIAAAVAPLQKQIAELTEDDATPIADAARAAAPLLRGRGPVTSALNFLAANPDLAKSGVELAQSALSTVEKAIARVPPPSPPGAPAVVRPRAIAAASAPTPESPFAGESAEVVQAWQSLPVDRSSPSA